MGTESQQAGDEFASDPAAGIRALRDALERRIQERHDRKTKERLASGVMIDDVPRNVASVSANGAKLSSDQPQLAHQRNFDNTLDELDLDVVSDLPTSDSVSKKKDAKKKKKKFDGPNSSKPYRAVAMDDSVDTDLDVSFDYSRQTADEMLLQGGILSAE